VIAVPSYTLSSESAGKLWRKLATVTVTTQP
jgi:hypothetical protein